MAVGRLRAFLEATLVWEFALTRLEACPRETIESILVCSVWESAMLSSQAWPLDISKALFEVSFLDSGFGKR